MRNKSIFIDKVEHGPRVHPDAPAAKPLGAGDLGVRAATAVALAGFAMLEIWAGGIPFAALTLAGLALLIWEWMGLVAPAAVRAGRALFCLAGVLGAGLALYAFGWTGLAAPAAPVWFLLAGGLAFALLAAAGMTWPARAVGPAPAAWRLRFAALGWAPWFLPAAFAAPYLRAEHGMAGLLFPCIVVIANDIGAYGVGRTLGGPKLAPRISPGKTWSGCIGGVACGVAAGLGFAWAAGWGLTAACGVAAAGLASLSVLGDLGESAVKRHAGVKDSGRLLPGHGGLFDRLDGILIGIPTFASIAVAFGWPL